MNARLKAIEHVDVGAVYRVVLETAEGELLPFDFSVSGDDIVVVKASEEFQKYTGMGWLTPTEHIYRAVKSFHDAQAFRY